MCTVVLRLAPGARDPLLMLGIRDEFLDRPWRPPGRHWPPAPVIGGLDARGGGTWLAVNPAERRMSCILNGRGEPAPQPLRRSRGELPLRPGVTDLTPYDPFHLLYADATVARLLSWDGASAVTGDLGPGTHVLTNAGRTDAKRADDPKAAHFHPRFAAARDWDDWQVLAEGDGLAVDDPRAIIVRRELPDGRVWGTSSVSMVALAADGGIRYEFRSVDGDWKPVEFLHPDGYILDGYIPDDGPVCTVPTSSSSTGARRRSSARCAGAR
jgi:Transport and Golgi organisation 2